MISLNYTPHQKASKLFFDNVFEKVKKRLKCYQKTLNREKTLSGESLYKYLTKNDFENLKSLLVDPLEELISKHEKELEPLKYKFRNVYNSTKKPTKFKKAITKVFFYEDYDSWKPYEILRALSVDCCPYCNRSYVTTLGTDTKKFLRADMDHFLAKSQYPFFRFSFYNLIPSCAICNQKAKISSITNPETHIYPYSDEFGDDIKFTFNGNNYYTLKTGSNARIGFKFEGNNVKLHKKAENSIKLFKLEQQYEIHHRELNQILNKKSKNGLSYVKGLRNAFGSLIFSSEQEAYEFIFGKPFKNNEFINQPLSKFTKDISEEINLL